MPASTSRRTSHRRRTARRAATRAAELGNGLDCVVSCADIRLDGPVDEVGSREWDVMMDVNVKSVFLLAASAMPYLEEMHGSIVAVAPGSEGDGAGEHAVLDATRAAVIALLNSLAAELAPRNVRVNVVLPEESGHALSADAVADRIWTVAGVDDEGHVRSLRPLALSGPVSAPAPPRRRAGAERPA
jgi:NAD(P)-dependent dehydrogenase (short-subunit alcohol dehydrogenase family)